MAMRSRLHFICIVQHISANLLIIHAFLIKFDMCRNTFGKVHPISHPCLAHRKFLTDNDHENECARRAVQKQSRFYLVSDFAWHFGEIRRGLSDFFQTSGI